jgi:hypothetical protein
MLQNFPLGPLAGVVGNKALRNKPFSDAPGALERVSICAQYGVHGRADY